MASAPPSERYGARHWSWDVSEIEYRAEIRSAVRGLWVGALDYFQSWDAIDIAIHRQIPKAYHEGAKQCGIEPSELTPTEKSTLQQIIAREIQYIDRLLIAVEENSKVNGGKLSPLFSRVNLWVGRYRDAKSQAAVSACGDQKFKWMLNPAEHCGSCKKLAGKIKRGSYWQMMGIYPQCGLLECVISAGGIPVCKCTLEPTNEPASKGPLPNLP